MFVMYKMSNSTHKNAEFVSEDSMKNLVMWGK